MGLILRSLDTKFTMDSNRVLYLAVNKRKGGKSMQGYCARCRAKKEIKDPKAMTMKNGKPATQGVCPTCGAKMFRIGRG